MKKKNRSLINWLFYIIVAGAFVMGLVMVIISMAMYMRSVRRIYKGEMLGSAGAAIELAGYDNIRRICMEGQSGLKSDDALISDVETALEQIYDEDGLTGMSLYCFDEDTMQGKLIISAYPKTSFMPSEISFGKIELDRLLNKEATRDLKRHAKSGFDSTVYKDIRDEDGRIIGLLSVSIELRETLNARIRFLVIYVPVFILLMAVFSSLALHLIKGRIIRPLGELADAAKRFGASDISDGETERDKVFSEKIAGHDDEIASLWETCSEMENSLYESFKRLKTVTAEKERQAAEMEVASQIQKGMLPDPGLFKNDNPGFGIAGSMTPAKGVGGDFYDYFMIDEDHLALVIGDVSGKGIPAALFMMMSMTQIRMHSAADLGPAAVITAANRAICANNPEMMFVTVWMGIVEISTGIMLECNAGHEYPAYAPAGGEYVLDTSEHDMPCGLMEDAAYIEKRRELKSGDRIFVYSDGLPEANNAAEEQFGTDRMVGALNENEANEDEELLLKVKSSVLEFTQGAPAFDDLTMLSFTYIR